MDLIVVAVVLGGLMLGLPVWIVWSIRRTHRQETQQLAVGGRTPWPPGRRRQARNLILLGAGLTLVGILREAGDGHRSILSTLLTSVGLLEIGLGLARSHAVLQAYFGRRRAVVMEVVQSVAMASAFCILCWAEVSRDPGQRLAGHLLALVPLAVHYLVVWEPLARTAERQELGGVPRDPTRLG